jgi:two-component system chemotaxis response regulator CheY
LPTAGGNTDQTVTIDSPLAPTGPHTSAFELGPLSSSETAHSATNPTARLDAIVAEPSRTQAGIIRNFLKQLGIESVHTVGSGREVIDAVKRTTAGVVISSLHLSDMTAIQLALALRADPGCRDVGFVLATSETNSETLANLPKDERTVVMPKPFDLDRLSESIKKVVG